MTKTIADCAAQIMTAGQVLSYRSPLSIIIYDYYMVCNGDHRQVSAARKYKAVISALGKDSRFEALFMPGSARPNFVLSACKQKNLIYN